MQDTNGKPDPDAELPVLALIHGEPLRRIPNDLYIPPDALEVLLDTFEGPLDLLLYLIRKQNFDILDIPMAKVTAQYLAYVDEIRSRNLELAAEYLLMAAMLIDIKSRMLLPVKKADSDEEVEDPRAELARRLLEYERIKYGAAQIDALPVVGRDFVRAQVHLDHTAEIRLPDVSARRRARTTCGPPGPRCCAGRGWCSITRCSASRCRCASTCPRSSASCRTCALPSSMSFSIWNRVRPAWS
jgi:scpA/B protein